MNRFKELQKGQKVEIHSYKHNGQIHRIWKYGSVVAVHDNYIVIVNNQTQVIESNGRVWYTKEPAVCYFFTDSWYNVISMIRSTGVHYYCNLASPFIWDGEAIKYIDYDLDLKVYPNNTMRILDQKEYAFHFKLMNYPQQLDTILNNELDRLMQLASNNSFVFDRDKVYKDFSLFHQICGY